MYENHPKQQVTATTTSTTSASGETYTESVVTVQNKSFVLFIITYFFLPQQQ